MNKNCAVNKQKDIKRVSVLGIIFNLILMVLKLFIGFVSKSQAMIADGMNSAGDIFASAMSYIGAIVSSKPEDREHPYGHGKAEYIFALLISISMIIASVTMVQSSVNSIMLGESLEFSYWLLIICVLTIIIKLSLYIYVDIQSKKYNSILLVASKEDHRNDIFLAIGTLIGIVASICGYTFLDGLFGILTSLWITYAGLRIFRNAYYVLMDTSIDVNKQKEIIDKVEKHDKVLHVDSIKSKPIGQKHIIILKISMDGNMTLSNSHKIGGIIKSELIKEFEYISDVVIHINPHNV